MTPWSIRPASVWSSALVSRDERISGDSGAGRKAAHRAVLISGHSERPGTFGSGFSPGAPLPRRGYPTQPRVPNPGRPAAWQAPPPRRGRTHAGITWRNPFGVEVTGARAFCRVRSPGLCWATEVAHGVRLSGRVNLPNEIGESSNGADFGLSRRSSFALFGSFGAGCGQERRCTGPVRCVVCGARRVLREKAKRC